MGLGLVFLSPSLGTCRRGPRVWDRGEMGVPHVWDRGDEAPLLGNVRRGTLHMGTWGEDVPFGPGGGEVPRFGGTESGPSPCGAGALGRDSPHLMLEEMQFLHFGEQGVPKLGGEGSGVPTLRSDARGSRGPGCGQGMPYASGVPSANCSSRGGKKNPLFCSFILRFFFPFFSLPFFLFFPLPPGSPRHAGPPPAARPPPAPAWLPPGSAYRARAVPAAP